MKKAKKILLMTSLVTSALVVTACGTNENKEEETVTKSIDDEKQGVAVGEINPSIPNNEKEITPDKSVETVIEKEAPLTSEPSKPSLADEKKSTPSSVTKKVEIKTVSLFDIKVDKDYKAEFHSGWKQAPSTPQQATIDGRGEGAVEEGEGILVVQNTKTNQSKLFTMKAENEAQLTPKFVEWIDDNHLYVIIGFSYGTVSKGGSLYEVNLDKNTVIPVIANLKDTEEIMSIKKNENGTFTYEKHIYDDENYNEGHIEKGTLPVSPTK